MNIKNIKHTLRAVLVAGMVGTLAASCVDNDFDDPTGQGTFYSSTKITAAEFIDANLDRFSSFKAILEKGRWFSTLQTYGQYTVFLPENAAVDTYLKARGLTSVEQLSPNLCDTLSRSHLIEKTARFTTDDETGSLMNMDDHFIVFSSDTINKEVVYIVNQTAHIIEKDDSLTNGVIHVVDRIISSTNQFLPDYIKNDTAVSIFSEALQATGLAQRLTKYLDLSYVIGDDSVRGEIPPVYYGGCDGGTGKHGEGHLRYPSKRYFKYTLFMEPNKVMNANGIYNLPDLIRYAKDIYDATYPEDAGIDDVTNPRNSLNRFVAYHMMDRAGTYADWAPSGEIYANNWKPDVADAEDWWETMCPGQPIRFSRLENGNLYANSSKGKKKTDGVRVLQNAQYKDKTKVNPDPDISPDNGPLNGNYLYLEDMLVFSPQVRDRLKVRMRIDATTLSPDFMNQGARGNYAKEILCMFKNAYVTNFRLSDETILGVHNDDMWWSSYLGNAVCIKGRYDMSFKLPPVPEKGQYEIRLGYVARSNGSTMQVYLDDTPCGIPFNQTIGAWDSRVGFEDDKKDSDEGYEDETERLAYNKGIDKTMRNHGYMKAMDSYRKGTGAVSFRVDASESLRRILVSNVELDPMKEGGHWLRFRKADNSSDNTEFSFDYIEIVPVDVYNDPNGEDQH